MAPDHRFVHVDTHSRPWKESGGPAGITELQDRNNRILPQEMTPEATLSKKNIKDGRGQNEVGRGKQGRFPHLATDLHLKTNLQGFPATLPGGDDASALGNPDVDGRASILFEQSLQGDAVGEALIGDHIKTCSGNES